MSKCAVCGREVETVVDVGIHADDPADEPVKYDLCVRCFSIITALNGTDKFRIVMDMLLDVLTVFNQMLAKDLEYGLDEEPRKTVVEALYKWQKLAAMHPWPPYDPIQ